jgi:hypothetical protein
MHFSLVDNYFKCYIIALCLEFLDKYKSVVVVIRALGVSGHAELRAPASAACCKVQELIS